jgi:hypothetical protein
MNVLPTLQFTSIEYHRSKDGSDRAVVLSDCDRPEGFPDLVGRKISIDGRVHFVVGIDNPYQPLRKGQKIVLWVDAAGVNQVARGSVKRRSPR